MEVKVIKGRKKFNKFLVRWSIRFVTLSFVFYTIFTLTGLYAKINEKKKYLNYLNSEITIQKNKNEELRKISGASDEENKDYFIKLARNLGFSKQNEKIFANISGNWIF